MPTDIELAYRILFAYVRWEHTNSHATVIRHHIEEIIKLTPSQITKTVYMRIFDHLNTTAILKAPRN